MLYAMNYILLTIDVEDWFQVENFKPWIPFSSWPSRELRVEKNTHKILDLFDNLVLTQNSEFKTQNSIKATFFALGWIAERLPNLVREIHSRGHEVASHGYYHNLCNQQSAVALKKDLTDSKKLLEDIIGSPVFGFRIQNLILPLGGGGYFRLIPFHLFKLGVQSILKKQKAYLFYMHTWEVDPEQPIVAEASKFFKFRHYINLSKTHSKLLRLIRSFQHCHFVTCSQYLSTISHAKAWL
jgi:hypothetical protein